MAPITGVTGIYIPTYNWGGPHCMCSGQNYLSSLYPAMHKLGSYSSCKVFSTPAGVTNGVSVEGRPLSVMKVLALPQKGQGEAKPS